MHWLLSPAQPEWRCRPLQGRVSAIGLLPPGDACHSLETVATPVRIKPTSHKNSTTWMKHHFHLSSSNKFGLVQQCHKTHLSKIRCKNTGTPRHVAKAHKCRMKCTSHNCLTLFAHIICESCWFGGLFYQGNLTRWSKLVLYLTTQDPVQKRKWELSFKLHGQHHFTEHALMAKVIHKNARITLLCTNILGDQQLETSLPVQILPQMSLGWQTQVPI